MNEATHKTVTGRELLDGMVLVTGQKIVRHSHGFLAVSIELDDDKYIMARAVADRYMA